MSNKYEAVIVYSTKLDEEATAAMVQKFSDLIAANGTVEAVDEWGKRRLAYEINDEREGYYTVYNFSAEPDFSAELNRILMITDGVLRSMIIRKDK